MGGIIEYTSADLSTEALAKADCIVLTTNHKNLDMELIKTHSKLIVDMRNMIAEETEKIIKL